MGLLVAEMDTPERERRFAEMAEQHARFMFRVAHGLLRSVHDAEDAVQEALLKLYRTDGWLQMQDERAFLARAVWRTALDVAARRPKPGATEDTAGRELVWDGRSPEQSAAEDDERALLRSLIDALPEELRQTLVLSAIEEMTSREVAATLGIPREVRVLRGAGMGLDERAVAAVQQWRFKPAMENGKPVAVRMNVIVDFQIE